IPGAGVTSAAGAATSAAAGATSVGAAAISAAGAAATSDAGPGGKHACRRPRGSRPHGSGGLAMRLSVRRYLGLLALVGCLAGGGPSRAASPAVQDNAGLFRPETRQRAEEEIHDL